jgi:hypothetical protein
MSDTTARSGRETRLLLLVIAVAVAALLLLARFRFPEAAERAPVVPTPGPFALTPRPSFRDLATEVAGLIERLAPSFAVVVVEDIPEPPPRGAPRSVAPPVIRHQAALRVSADRALIYLPSGSRLVAGAADGNAAPAVADPARPVAMVSVPPVGETPTLLASALDAFDGFGYAVLIEGARGGATGRPVFVGRLDAATLAGWPAPLAMLGGSTGVAPGAFLVTLEGRLIGLTIAAGDEIAIVPPRLLEGLASADTGEAAKGKAAKDSER